MDWSKRKKFWFTSGMEWWRIFLKTLKFLSSSVFNITDNMYADNGFGKMDKEIGKIMSWARVVQAYSLYTQSTNAHSHYSQPDI
jgi:hypothetical protein